MRTFSCPVLVGRDEEFAALVELLDDASAGRGSVALVSGDAGVGKSRLVRELEAVATAGGFDARRGRAAPHATQAAFRPLAEVVLGMLREGPPPDAPELHGFHQQLARLVPLEGVAAPGDSSPMLVGEAFVRLLRVLGGETPWLIVVEDVHWADDETLEVLDYLAGVLSTERVLVVVTTRDTTDLAARVRAAGGTHLTLDPLTDRSVEAMAAACLGDEVLPPDLGGFLAAHSDGSPLLVEELLAGLGAAGSLVDDGEGWRIVSRLVPRVPTGMAQSVRLRLEDFDVDDRNILAAAATLGRSFDWELLAGIAGTDGASVVDALRAGVERQLLEVDGSTFRFRHALTRECVLDTLLPPERQALAERAAVAVGRAHPGLPGGWIDLRAALTEAAGDPAGAALLLVESAMRSVEQDALVTAERALARARVLSAGTDAEAAAHRASALAAALAGQPARALELGGNHAETVDDHTLLGQVALDLRDVSRAKHHAAAARELGVGTDAASAAIELLDAAIALAEGRIGDAERRAHMARDLAVTANTPEVECRALEILALANPDFASQTVAYRALADVAAGHGLALAQVRALQAVAVREAVLGRADHLAEVRQLCESAGAVGPVSTIDLLTADLALFAHDHDTCLAAAERAVDTGRRYRLGHLPVALLWLAGAHALAGRSDAMETALAEAEALAPGDPRVLGDGSGRVRALAAWLAADDDAFLAALDASMPHARVAPAAASGFLARVLWALVRTASDDDAGSAARAEVWASRSATVPIGRAILGIADAVALGRAGDAAAAEQRFAAAEDDLPEENREWGCMYTARLLAAEAAASDGWGDPAGWARRCEAAAVGAGHDAVAQRSRALLRALGEPVPRRRQGDATVPSALRGLGVTGREFEVLTELVEGRTNKEIAERLFLSPRTVEHHVASLLRRTGAKARGELATHLGG